MLVSVVSVFHNREASAFESVKSILDQTYRDIEIILVDDGSTDNTFDILNRFNDSRIRLIKQKNQGFTKSIKNAIEMSRGEVIAIHGAGDISLSTRIEKQVKLLKERQDVGIVGCYVEMCDTENDSSSLYIPPSDSHKSMTEILKRKNIFTHGEVIFRKDVYVRAGGYRDFFRYAQDRDLWLRMSLITNYAIVPERLYIRYHFKNGVSKSFEKRIMQKYYGSIMLQCIEMRVAGKKDLIDTFGENAAFFRSRDKKLSKNFIKWSLMEFSNNRIDRAKYLVGLSNNEFTGVLNMAVKLLIKISSKNELIKRLFISFIKWAKVVYRRARKV